MPAAPDDWRRRGQEAYLRGAALAFERYRAPSPQWDHEHCEFCWQTFLDVDSSAEHRRAVEDGSGEFEPAGYTNFAANGVPAGEWWICQVCHGDFAEEFGWVVVGAVPDQD